MKMKNLHRVLAFAGALVMAFGMSFALPMFAEGEDAAASDDTAQYASTDYANKKDLFEQVMAATEGTTVTFPLPDAYKEGVTTRMKYIVDGALIKEKYADKTFVMPFCGIDLTFDGAFLAEVGGKRIEIAVEQKVPIAIQYSCPKCTTTVKRVKSGDTYVADPNGKTYSSAYSDVLESYEKAGEDSYICPRCGSTIAMSEFAEPEHNERVTGAKTLIEEKKHAVVGQYVVKLDIYSDGKAISSYEANGKGIEGKLKVDPQAMESAKSEGRNTFNVYAYMSHSKNYDNMGATVDAANGTATFKVQDSGWFYIAADDRSSTELNADQQLKNTLKWLIPVIVIVLVAVAAVVAFLVMKKKKATQD